MKVAIVHYHLELRRGLHASLKTRWKRWTSVMTPKRSSLPEESTPVTASPTRSSRKAWITQHPNRSISPELLVERMKECAQSSLGGMPDLWHIHNHSLGKNPSLTKVRACWPKKASSCSCILTISPKTEERIISRR